MYVLSMKENTNLKLYPAIFLVSFAVRISPSLFSNPHDLHHLTKQCFNETFWEIMHYKTKYTGDSLEEEVLLCFKVHCKNLPKTILYFTLFTVLLNSLDITLMNC
uniref:Uncharacterized protein n=1 Tax=Micrurus spixii TaxID=129469 RepID=A0A2D4MDK1_9SAUR